MSSVVSPSMMTADEFLALPKDEVRRELIYGELREEPVTFRNRKHSNLEISIGSALRELSKTQP